MKKNLKSAKTTIAGALAAVGAWAMSQSDPSWLASVGSVVEIVALALLGYWSRDNDKSSEDVGAN